MQTECLMNARQGGIDGKSVSKSVTWLVSQSVSESVTWLVSQSVSESVSE